MLDIKEIDSGKHKQLTGHTNENILAMGDYLSAHGTEMWIRHVLVPGLTDEEEGLRLLRKKVDEWRTVSRIEVLPYHTLGLSKWENLGVAYPLEGVRTPTENEVLRAEEILAAKK